MFGGWDVLKIESSFSVGFLGVMNFSEYTFSYEGHKDFLSI